MIVRNAGLRTMNAPSRVASILASNTGFFPFLPSLNSWNSEPLDPCIACDEKLCGPAFLECAGANRRRAGVISDIERDLQNEVCQKVNLDWILTEYSPIRRPKVDI